LGGSPSGSPADRDRGGAQAPAAAASRARSDRRAPRHYPDCRNHAHASGELRKAPTMNRNLKLNNSGPYSRMAFRGALGVLAVLLAAAGGSGQSAEELRLTVGKSVVIDYPS